jgi:hypothetical protein
MSVFPRRCVPVPASGDATLSISRGHLYFRRSSSRLSGPVDFTSSCGVPAKPVRDVQRISRERVAAVANRTDKRAAECLANADRGCNPLNDSILSAWRHPCLVPRDSDLRGLGGCVPDRLNGLDFSRPPIEAFVPRTGPQDVFRNRH